MNTIHPRVLVIVFAALVASFTWATDRPAIASKSESFDANGVKIHYIVEGQGDPVVLIHGLHASAAINWGFPGIIAALAEKHQVIALDLPGHGASDKPEDESAYGVQMVEDVVLLMDHLKVSKAQVVGYSLGGMIGAKLMVLHPDRVTACVMGGMGWVRDGSALQNMLNGGRREGGIAKFGMGQLGITEKELKAIKVPTILLVGSRDPVKRMYVEPLEAVRKDWPVVEIPDAGHLDCIIKPQFKSEIVKWVDEHSAK